MIPFYIQVQLTNRCNLKCIHCYVGTEKLYEIDTQCLIKWLNKAIKTIRAWEKELNRKFNIIIALSGGEPLLYKNIKDILDEVQFDKVYLLSNGQLNFESVKDIIKRVTGVQISLDGPREINDKIRGKESYDKAITFIKELEEHEKLLNISFTVNKINYIFFDNLYNDLKNVKTEYSIKRYIPAFNKKLTLSEEEFASFVNNVSLYENVFVEDPICFCNDNKGQQYNFGGCYVGFTGISLTSEGNIIPCSKLPIVLGNIKADSFEDVWYTDTLLNKIRNKNNYSFKCANCEKWNKCRGCRAFTYYSRNSILGDDDYCSENLLTAEIQ